eukprot:3836120-Amphidinium_carterae.1
MDVFVGPMGVAVGMYLLSRQNIAEHGADVGVQAVVAERALAAVDERMDLSEDVGSSRTRVTTAVWNYRSTQKLDFKSSLENFNTVGP